MRENRLYGSEGGESQLNATSLPLSCCRRIRGERMMRGAAFVANRMIAFAIRP